MLGLKPIFLHLAALFSFAAAEVTAAGGYKATYGEVYVERDSGPLKADVYAPDGEGPFPGVLVVHGGAWRTGTRGQLAGVAQMLAENGFTAVAISYRLAPQFKFPAQIEDCKAAVRWMRMNAARLKIDPTHIGGYGYSAGAHLVSLLGTIDDKADLEGVADVSRQPSTRLQCIAAGGAPCDLRPIPADVDGLAFFLGGSPAVCPEQYRLASPAAFVSSDDPPMFFFHGERDQLVPLSSPERMRQELTKAGVEADLYIVPNVGHIAAAMDRAAIGRAIGFLADHLKPRE